MPPHVHLTGINITKTEANPNATEAGYAEIVYDGPKLNLDETASYPFRIAGGYPCMLTGWTKTANYATCFYRDKTGSAKAVVSELKPGAEYEHQVCQYNHLYAISK